MIKTNFSSKIKYSPKNCWKSAYKNGEWQSLSRINFFHLLSCAENIISQSKVTKIYEKDRYLNN